MINIYLSEFVSGLNKLLRKKGFVTLKDFYLFRNYALCLLNSISNCLYV